jgi:hypothetical protein
MFVFRRSGWAVVAGILTACAIVWLDLVFAANM